MGCMTVASMLKGKSASEIRKDWNIKHDFTEKTFLVEGQMGITFMT